MWNCNPSLWWWSSVSCGLFVQITHTAGGTNEWTPGCMSRNPALNTTSTTVWIDIRTYAKLHVQSSPKLLTPLVSLNLKLLHILPPTLRNIFLSTMMPLPFSIQVTLSHNLPGVWIIIQISGLMSCVENVWHLFDCSLSTQLYKFAIENLLLKVEVDLCGKLHELWPITSWWVSGGLSKENTARPGHGGSSVRGPPTADVATASLQVAHMAGNSWASSHGGHSWLWF